MSEHDLIELAEALEACTFNELCERYMFDEKFIIECVDLGITVIEGRDEGIPMTQWQFTPTAVLRIEKARRLQRDLDIRLSDMALVLDLLDELEDLRNEVDFLRKRLRHWEPPEE